MKKETVYIPLTTPEECKRAYEILSRHGEPIYSSTKIWLSAGDLTGPFYYLAFNEIDGFWCGYLGSIRDIEITLSQLDELLASQRVEKILNDLPKPDFEKWKKADELLGGEKQPSGSIQHQIMKKYLTLKYGESEINYHFAYVEAMKEYADLQTSSLRKELEEKERFKMPTSKQIVDIAILFNEGKLETEKLSDMVGMCDFIIDRLYEHGDITKPSSKENNHE